MNDKSTKLFQEACERIPGGVNSPVRAFGPVGLAPRFIASANGARMTDVDGNTYIDYVCSWGPMILGHNHPVVREAVLQAVEQGLSFGTATEKEVVMAKLICELVPSVEMVRMVNSGTEAVMSAIRAARGYTGRSKLIKFEGCYHGHCDAMLVKAGSGVMTGGMPGSAGVPVGCTRDTLTAVYNDLDSVEALLKANQGEVAAIIVEPVAANMGVVPPKKGFLQGLKSLSESYGALLIFDEVITGFRLQIDGAQGYFGVEPDLTVFGKIIGAGMPVGAYGGKKAIMENIAPSGPVYQAGTLSGNPVAMAAGIAQLTYLKEHPGVYARLNAAGDSFYEAIEDILKEEGLPVSVNHIGSLGSIFFTKEKVVDYCSARTADTGAFAAYFKGMLSAGIYVAPSQFEAMFLSAAHGESELTKTLEAIRKCVSCPQVRAHRGLSILP